MRLSEEKLRGRAVISADGHVIGRITGMQVEVSTWQVEAVGIELRKDIADRIGIERGLFRAGTLDLPVRMIQSVGDTVVLTVTVDALKQVRETPAPATGGEVHA